MLFDALCFVNFVEENGKNVINYVDNWADGSAPKYYFFDDLVIDMGECIHIEVAKIYLQKLNAQKLNNQIINLDCPCNN